MIVLANHGASDSIVFAFDREKQDRDGEMRRQLRRNAPPLLPSDDTYTSYDKNISVYTTDWPRDTCSHREHSGDV